VYNARQIDRPNVSTPEKNPPDVPPQPFFIFFETNCSVPALLGMRGEKSHCIATAFHPQIPTRKTLDNRGEGSGLQIAGTEIGESAPAVFGIFTLSGGLPPVFAYCPLEYPAAHLPENTSSIRTSHTPKGAERQALLRPTEIVLGVCFEKMSCLRN
jgi:hypothetical protein